jgi:hypothetical protein
MAEVTFKVQVPPDTALGADIGLEVLDEVTGLTINPRRYTMERIDLYNHALVFPVPIGSVIKYRYIRLGAVTATEFTSLGEPVRYRLYPVTGPGEVQDIVARWSDTPYSGPIGRIEGQVNDISTSEPLANLMVTAGGVYTFSAADGSFHLEGLPPGTHNLVAYALDGSYKPFSQGAVVEGNVTTPADLRLEASPLVNVVFTVVLPGDTVPNVPVRLAGNLYQLGNTYADLNGGLSTLASRMPMLSPLPDGRYTITLALPVGADVRYKYTLGDGLWNAEHTPQGAFKVRQLIVPDHNVLIEDMVATWKAGNSAPIWFDVTIPENTPAADSLSIQFHPGVWTEPLPMWAGGGNRWLYLLSSPLDMLGSFGYRYCRNDQCGLADDAATHSPNTPGRTINTSVLLQTLVDQVDGWQWFAPPDTPTTVVTGEIQPRDSFFAGVAFQKSYHPSWQSRLPVVINTLPLRGMNALVLSPTWTFLTQNPLCFQPLPGRDPLLADINQMIHTGRNAGLQIALFPQVNFLTDEATWWQTAPRDAAWWEDWFGQYKTFARHHAILAEQQGASLLILGGEDLNPALPGGKLANGEASGVPQDAVKRWKEIINEVRAVYSGRVAWAITYQQAVESPPAFLNAVDVIYLLWYAPLADNANADPAAMQAEANRLLNTQVRPFQEQVGKPLILAVAYPSADGGSTGCLPAPQGGCLASDELNTGSPALTNLQTDLEEQVQAYNAMLNAVNQRGWIEGFVARGYYPPVILHDPSNSIHGKPAEEVLSYWFTRILQTTP